MSNTTILSDLLQLTKDDLIDEYEKLGDAYRQLKRSEDGHLQQIHELRRSLQTATNAETYLAAELESISSVHNGELENLRLKHATELEAVRKNHAESLDMVVGLEGELETLRQEVDPLRQALQEMQHLRSEPKVDLEKSAKLLERLTKSEDQNSKLVEVVETVREQLTQALKQIVQNEKRIEDLCDQLECVQLTLDSKREELDEKTQLFETAQERICQLNGELAVLQTQPETDTQKRGNSLFAEVDDQRQEMRIKFAAQKKHYMQMKFEFDQSQQEIRSLKRENAAMHKELQICSAMFMNADKTYKEKLNERIGQLLSDNQKLDSKLRCTESMLVSMGNEHGVTWLDSMLSFCKNETNEMRETLRSCRLQKSTAEEMLHNVTQDMAKWRFEALKSRCVIINRETLLEEHKIAFDADPDKISKMTQLLDTPSAQPNIVDTSSCILRPSNTKRQSLHLPSAMETSSKVQVKLERRSPLPTAQSDDMDIESSENMTNFKPELVVDDPILLTPKAKTNTETHTTPTLRSPLQTLSYHSPNQNTTPSTKSNNCTAANTPSHIIPSDTRSSITTFVPQYRKITISKESMASLEKNIARIQSSLTPRCKNVKRALNLPDMSSAEPTQRDFHRPKVTFSDSTTEAAANAKEIGLPERKVNVSPVDIKIEVKIESKGSRGERQMQPGINRRIMVKSKKPTVFPD